MKKLINLVALIALPLCTITAQLEDINPDYLNTLNNRAGKIVKGMELSDSEQAERVKKIIVIQYYELSKIHDNHDAKLEEIKKLEGEEKESAKKELKTKTHAQLYKQHAKYIAHLSAELSQDQVEQVKDGMTYGVVKRTYTGYLNLLPDLTDDQKKYIYANLVEAREFAMDAGSSKAKHAWFGKYKGRINNYLSKAGYDLKQAELDLKAREEKKK
jgi:hypothetical protein